MLGEEPRGLLEKGFKKRGCTPPFNPPEDVVLERDTHPRCKKRGARLISRELNLPSLTWAASTKEIVGRVWSWGNPMAVVGNRSWTRRSLNFKKGGRFFPSNRWKIGWCVFHRCVDRCIWGGKYFSYLPSDWYLFYYISVKVPLFSYFLMRNTVILYSVYE